MNFKHVPHILSKETRQKVLDIALKPGAFMDNSYHISFFKHPILLDELGMDGPWQLQLLKQTEKESQIHQDKNRTNEFDNIFMPRNCVISWPLCGDGETCFYDKDHNLIEKTTYDNNGAILNTGGCLHNVVLNTDEPRIVFQMCFEEDFNEVVNMYDACLSGRSY